MCGIYGCTAKFDNGMVIFTSQCWSLVSFAATAEWTLSVLWMIFVGTVAYDNYHLEDTVQMLLMTPPPLPREGRGLGFWKARWGKKVHAAHDLENWSGRPDAIKAHQPELDLEQETQSLSRRNSIVESMDDRRVEEYSPLGHQGRTWLQPMSSITRPDLSSRGYQQVSNSPSPETS